MGKKEIVRLLARTPQDMQANGNFSTECYRKKRNNLVETFRLINYESLVRLNRFISKNYHLVNKTNIAH